MDKSQALTDLIIGIDLALWGKQYHYEQDDGSWYLRNTGEYTTLDGVVKDVINDVSYCIEPIDL